MRKLTALIWLITALLTASALTADAETAPTLWPAYDPETGLWGYIDEEGAWGIEAHYRHAYDFVNGYAEVGMNDHLTASGIINQTGAYIFQPEYSVERGTIGFDSWAYNNLYLLEKGDLWGWFDTESGYISGLCWTRTESYDDTPYVIASMGDKSTFVHRATNERLLPLTDMFTYGFYEGYAVCWDADDQAFIVALDGTVTELPEEVEVSDSYFSDGLLLVEDENSLYGYADVNGQIVIAPQYEHGELFKDGYTVVEKDGEYLLIDRENRIIATGWLYVCGMWADNGIAVEGDNCWAVLNQDGTERFRIALEPYEYARGVFTEPPLVEDGPWWVGYWYGGNGIDFGLMTADGTWLHNAGDANEWFNLDGEMFSSDPMGWQAAGLDGKWGYIDAYGNTVLPFIYDDAEHFTGALARVRFDESTEGYINRSGEIVYQWPYTDDEW